LCAPAAAAQAWTGQLEVRQQAGQGCTASPPAPYAVPVEGMELDGGFLLWGTMQTVRLLPGAAPGAAHRLESPGGASLGEAHVIVSEHGLQARWLEDAGAGAGCSYAEAQLRLRPVAEPARQAQIGQFGQYLRQLHSAHAALLRVTERAQAAAPAEALVALAARLPQAHGADKAIAQLFIEAGEHLAALRQRPQALGLLRAASTLYRRHAAEYPEDAAMAFAAEARLRYRSGGLAAAQPLVDEAAALLLQHGRTDGAAAASLWSMLGAWQLRGGDADAALATFARAVRADEARGAAPRELAMSLSNLGTAMRALGQDAAALQVWRSALALAESSGEPAQSLVEIIRDHISQLARGSGAVKA
jgi:tetratricopeptide (TPR) repeat protein